MENSDNAEHLIFPQRHIADIRKGDLSIRMTTGGQPGGCSSPVCLFSQRKSSWRNLYVVLLKHNFFLISVQHRRIILVTTSMCLFSIAMYLFITQCPNVPHLVQCLLSSKQGNLVFLLQYPDDNGGVHPHFML